MDYDQIPICSCGKCECDIGSILAKKREEERVHQFLLGLDESLYGAVRSTLLAAEPLPPLNKVYSTLVQEERVKNVVRIKDDHSEIMALAVQGSYKGKGRGEARDKNLICTHCKKMGHEAGNCFQLVGYPDWWGERPRETKVAGRGRGSVSGGRGRGGVLRANVAQVATNSQAPGISTSMIGEGKQGVPDLNPEQWQSLLEIINSHKTNSATKMTGKTENNSWIIDTGASSHMTGSLANLEDVRKISACPVGLPNGGHVFATDIGSIKLNKNLVLSDVLYVPGLACNLISVSQVVDDNDCIAVFSKHGCALQDLTSKTLIGMGERKDGLYYLQRQQRIKAHKVDGMGSLDLWHARLGHPSLKVTKLISAIAIRKDSGVLNKSCDICHRAKQTRNSFPLSENKASDLFELIHCDLWGPYRSASSCGAHYFLTIVDDFSRAIWVTLLVDKKDVSHTLKNFFAMIERQFNKQVQIVRSDNGTEFVCLKNYFLEHGIIFQTSCTGTPQQNGRVEQKHQQILNVARALRFQGHILISFWGECVATAGYLIEQTPAMALDNKTSYEVLYGHKPSYEHLRVFGSLGYAHNQGTKGDKHAPIK